MIQTRASLERERVHSSKQACSEHTLQLAPVGGEARLVQEPRQNVARLGVVAQKIHDAPPLQSGKLAQEAHKLFAQVL